jgi:hypothetical protein
MCSGTALASASADSGTRERRVPEDHQPWWRGLPARARTTRLRSSDPTTGRMPPNHGQERQGQRQLQGQDNGASHPAHFEQGISPLAGSVDMTWVELGQRQRQRSTTREWRVPEDHQRWWRGLPARAGTTRLRSSDPTTGRMPVAPVAPWAGATGTATAAAAGAAAAAGTARVRFRARARTRSFRSTTARCQSAAGRAPGEGMPVLPQR